MRLSELETKRLLPSWMTADETDVLLSDGIDAVVRKASSDADVLSVWGSIESLSEDVVDELAWSLHVDWYESGASFSTKCDLVKSSDLVHAKLGTVSAVESVVESYFGEGRVREWVEYAGEPHHFKVFTTDPEAVGDNLVAFLEMLEKVKRKSSVLDAIQIGLSGESLARCGVGTKVTSFESIPIGWPPDPPIHVGPTGETTAKSAIAVRSLDVREHWIGWPPSDPIDPGPTGQSKTHVGHAVKVTTAQTVGLGFSI